jgi:hypothetical protein
MSAASLLPAAGILASLNREPFSCVVLLAKHAPVTCLMMRLAVVQHNAAVACRLVTLGCVMHYTTQRHKPACYSSIVCCSSKPRQDPHWRHTVPLGCSYSCMMAPVSDSYSQAVSNSNLGASAGGRGGESCQLALTSFFCVLRWVFSWPLPAAGPSFLSFAALRLSRPEPIVACCSCLPKPRPWHLLVENVLDTCTRPVLLLALVLLLLLQHCYCTTAAGGLGYFELADKASCRVPDQKCFTFCTTPCCERLKSDARHHCTAVSVLSSSSYCCAGTVAAGCRDGTRR